MFHIPFFQLWYYLLHVPLRRHDYNKKRLTLEIPSHLSIKKLNFLFPSNTTLFFITQETRPKCARCSGTGYEPCTLCSRWENAKTVGCDSCNSGFMRCRGCGGGGTSVPIDSRAVITDGAKERELINERSRTRNF